MWRFEKYEDSRDESGYLVCWLTLKAFHDVFASCSC